MIRGFGAAKTVSLLSLLLMVQIVFGLDTKKTRVAVFWNDYSLIVPYETPVGYEVGSVANPTKAPEIGKSGLKLFLASLDPAVGYDGVKTLDTAAIKSEVRNNSGVMTTGGVPVLPNVRIYSVGSEVTYNDIKSDFGGERPDVITVINAGGSIYNDKLKQVLYEASLAEVGVLLIGSASTSFAVAIDSLALKNGKEKFFAVKGIQKAFNVETYKGSLLFDFDLIKGLDGKPDSVVLAYDGAIHSIKSVSNVKYNEQTDSYTYTTGSAIYTQGGSSQEIDPAIKVKHSYGQFVLENAKAQSVINYDSYDPAMNSGIFYDGAVLAMDGSGRLITKELISADTILSSSSSDKKTIPVNGIINEAGTATPKGANIPRAWIKVKNGSDYVSSLSYKAGDAVTVLGAESFGKGYAYVQSSSTSSEFHFYSPSKSETPTVSEATGFYKSINPNTNDKFPEVVKDGGMFIVKAKDTVFVWSLKGDGWIKDQLLGSFVVDSIKLAPEGYQFTFTDDFKINNKKIWEKGDVFDFVSGYEMKYPAKGYDSLSIDIKGIATNGNAEIFDNIFTKGDSKLTGADSIMLLKKWKANGRIQSAAEIWAVDTAGGKVAKFNDWYKPGGKFDSTKYYFGRFGQQVARGKGQFSYLVQSGADFTKTKFDRLPDASLPAFADKEYYALSVIQKNHQRLAIVGYEPQYLENAVLSKNIIRDLFSWTAVDDSRMPVATVQAGVKGVAKVYSKGDTVPTTVNEIRVIIDYSTKSQAFYDAGAAVTGKLMQGSTELVVDWTKPTKKSNGAKVDTLIFPITGTISSKSGANTTLALTNLEVKGAAPTPSKVDLTTFYFRKLKGQTSATIPLDATLKDTLIVSSDLGGKTDVSGVTIFYSKNGTAEQSGESPLILSGLADKDSVKFYAVKAEYINSDTAKYSYTDVTAPKLITKSPADDAVNVPVTTNLVLTFDETVTAGTGNIVIKSDAGAIIATISIGDPQVKISGNTVTIDPTTDLPSGTKLHVLIASGVIKDGANNPFVGISDPKDWDFTTADIVAPKLISKTPADDAINVAVNTDLILTFDEPIVAGTGDIIIKSDAGTTIATIAIGDALQVKISGNTVTINPTDNLPFTTAMHVLIASGVIKDGSNNLFGGIVTSTDWNFTTAAIVDVVAPKLLTKTPADDAVGVAGSTNLVLTFDESVAAGTGSIVIKNEAGEVVQTIDITDATQVTITGTTVTIKPKTDLPSGTKLHVLIASGVIKDVANNPFVGITTSTEWDFTTADVVAPKLTAKTPVDGATKVPVTTDLVLTFDETVVAGTGDIVIKNEVGAIVATIAIGDPQVKISGNTVTINPTTDLPSGTKLHVLIASGVIKDVSSNPFVGITDSKDWDFTTADVVAPKLLTKSPADDATNVAVNTDLVLTFDEPIVAGTGDIVIKSDDGTIITTIAIGNPQVTISGNTVAINPTGNLPFTSKLHVLIASGVIKDEANNPFGGILDPKDWNFTTASVVDVVAPKLTTKSPADDAINVSVNTDLVLTFDEPIVAGTGNIVIKNEADAIIATIAIGDQQVKISGNTVTINPTADLPFTAKLHVLIASGVIKDGANNPFGGILTSTDWNFTTASVVDIVAPKLLTTTPADEAINVAVNTDLVLTFDEPIVAGTGDIVIKNEADATITTIAIGNPQVKISGNTVTINPTADLPVTSKLHVLIASGVIKDGANNPFGGILTATDWNFTTASVVDVVAPKLTTKSPADDAINVAVTTDLVLTFDEPIVAGTGDIVIKNEAGAIIATIAIGDPQVKISGNTVTVNPTTDLLSGQKLHVLIGSGVIKDGSNNPFVGIADPKEWDFTTADIVAPKLITLTPADNAVNVAVTTDLVLTFDEPIIAGTGDIVIKNEAGAIIATIAIGDPQVKISGTTVTINPTKDLPALTKLHVLIAAGAIKDVANNPFGGIVIPTDWDFTTGSQKTDPIVDKTISDKIDTVAVKIDSKDTVIVDLDKLITDADGDKLIFTVVSKDSSLVIGKKDPVTNELILEIKPNKTGKTKVIVTATDGKKSVSDTIDVIVDSDPTVDKIISDKIDTVLVKVDGKDTVIVDLNKLITDADGDKLDFTVISKDSSLVIGKKDPFTNELILDLQGKTGKTQVIVTATDGKTKVSDTIDVIIDSKPVVGKIISEKIDTTKLIVDNKDTVIVDLDSLITDTDGDKLIFKVVSKDSSLVIGKLDPKTNDLILDVQPNKTGKTQVIVTATDGKTTVSDTIEVVIKGAFTWDKKADFHVGHIKTPEMYKTSISPNPALAGSSKIRFDLAYQDADQAEVAIYSSVGTKVFGHSVNLSRSQSVVEWDFAATRSSLEGSSYMAIITFRSNGSVLKQERKMIGVQK